MHIIGLYMTVFCVFGKRSGTFDTFYLIEKFLNQVN